jgi:two-component system, response regulator, stage 0 sporulation protein F
MGANMGTVLVVDDSLTIRKLIELSLRSEGLKLEVAASIQEAIEKIRVTQPEVILLDYVLPDGRGIDFCWQAQEAGFRIPTIIVSGKKDAIRDQFREFPEVCGFLGKPFTQALVVAAVRAARHSTESPLSQPKGSAKAPPDATLRVEKGSVEPRRPSRDVTRAMDGNSVRLKVARGGLEADMAFHFQASSMVAATSLPSLAQGLEQGEIVIRGAEASLTLFVARNAAVMATTTNAKQYRSLCDLARANLALKDVQAALKSQEQTMAPYPVWLADQGLLRPLEVAPALRRASMALMSELFLSSGTRELTLIGYRRPVLPGYVFEHGVPLPMAQLQLEVLRSSGSVSITREDHVLERAAGFTNRLSDFSLTSEERRLLLLVDGKQTISELLRHQTSETQQSQRDVLERLYRVGLVVLRATRESLQPSSVVLVFDSDKEGVIEPLESMLRARGSNLATLNLGNQVDWLATANESRPHLVVMHVDEAPEKCMEFAREIRFGAASASFPIVALVGELNTERNIQLRTAGFDAVFEKPVHISQLERFAG